MNRKKFFEWKKQLKERTPSQPVQEIDKTSADETAIVLIASASFLSCLTLRYRAVKQAWKDRALNRKSKKYTEESLLTFRRH